MSEISPALTMREVIRQLMDIAAEYPDLLDEPLEVETEDGSTSLSTVESAETANGPVLIIHDVYACDTCWPEVYREQHETQQQRLGARG